jgi:hypothetical protein
MRASWLKTEKTQKEEGQWLRTSEPKALDGNLIRRRQWINDWLNTKARGSSSRSKRAARRRPDVFAGNVGIGVAEKEALPRSRAALHLGQAGWGDSKPAGFELRRLRHGGDVDGRVRQSGPPAGEITGGPPRSNPGRPSSVSHCETSPVRRRLALWRRIAPALLR